MFTSENIDIVIFHHPCPDGFTSCVIANMYFNSINKKVNYWGLAHSPNPPPELYDKLKNKNVLICDFSFKKDVIIKLLTVVKGLLIIDHHLSAQKDLQDFNQKYKIFDMKHCGAYLTWEYFFPKVPVPLFVKYIEDNDIWLKAMPKTLEVTAYVASLELSLEPECLNEFEKLILDESLITSIAIPIGEILLKQAQKQIDSALSKSTVKMIDFNNNIYFVGTCNSTTNISEIGNQMLSKYPFIDFSAIYNYNENGSSNSISLRSDDTRANVSVIASKCSGGGHRNASGCTLFEKTLPGFEIGDYNCYKQLKDLDFILQNAENQYNYVMLNSTQNKSQFSRYLLQVRNQEKINGEDKDAQEACAFYRIYKEDPKLFVEFDFAFTWHYGDNKTWFNMSWSSHKDYNIKELLKKFKDVEITEAKRCAKFSLPKLCLKIF
jgi:oligoribonuclease NrnB/cAMP/cGMP phosphodiesterase (DHH superfamily)